MEEIEYAQALDEAQAFVWYQAKLDAMISLLEKRILSNDLEEKEYHIALGKIKVLKKASQIPAKFIEDDTNAKR